MIVQTMPIGRQSAKSIARTIQTNCGYHVPGPTRLGKCRNPFCLPDFVSRSHARGIREIVMSRTSPRILLLHILPTDPLRRIYRLADSRSGTLESPAGRSFDPSAEGAMTTARPPLSLIICLCLFLLSTDYCLSPCCHTLRR